MTLPIYGFSFIRNGVYFDYPFQECLQSLNELCPEIYIAVGAGEDDTEEILAQYPFIKSTKTIWDKKLMGDGGQILSEQTNIALDFLRNDKSEEIKAWGFYLQGDELIHQDEVDLIRSDIEKAEREGYDAVRFRYWHFWLDHHHVAISKRWYPAEVRAIKLAGKAKSFGDAQGFKGQEKVLDSEASIFHYGHVRDKQKREEKQELLMKMIRPSEKLKKYINREKKDFAKTKTAPWLGKHPRWMKERIIRMGDEWEFPTQKKLCLIDPLGEVKKAWLDDIHAEGVRVVQKRSEVQAGEVEVNLTKNRPWYKLCGCWLPEKMESPLARPWGPRIQFYQKLFTKKISLKHYKGF
jgi:hypothetical protein